MHNIITHPKLFSAFESVMAESREKIGRQMNLCTLEDFIPATSLVTDQQLLPIRHSGTEAVLSSAKFTVRLSSSVAGKPLQCCSGFWIEWDEQNKVGIILTTAHLLRSKNPPIDHWLGKDEYAENAEVIVHLLDGTTVEGQLLYCQEHYGLAFIRVKVERPVQLPCFDEGVECGQKVFQIGRDESLSLKITYGMADFCNPVIGERYHFIYFSSEVCLNKDYYDGGPVINLDGKVVGIVNHSTRGSFIPSSVLLKCLNLWKKFGCIPGPQLGLKFLAIQFLDPVYVYKIWRKCNIDNGLIIEEVSEGSAAEKIGMRRGDVIEYLNGECISNTVQLENILLGICKSCLDRRDGFNAEMDLSMSVFHTRKCLRRVRELTVNISDCGEIVARGTYPFATKEEIFDEIGPGTSLYEDNKYSTEM